MSDYGRGGSARWATHREMYKSRFRCGKPGWVCLGKPLRSDWLYGGPEVGEGGDQHLFTVAGTGAGKGVSQIIPNLLEWGGSAMVIDPKGENAEVTARRRDKLGQKVLVLDPFMDVHGPAERFRACWNPLYEIATSGRQAREEIEKLAEDCIPEDRGASGKDAYFVTGARQMFAGVIAHVLTTEPIWQRNLPRVSELITTGGADLWAAMRRNPVLGGLAMQGGSYELQASPGEWGGLSNTLRQKTNWMASEAMASQLRGHHFDMASLKKDRTTIYIVLPAALMDEYKPWMRLVIGGALKTLSKMRRVQSKGGWPVLFLLDEFPVLGRFEAVEQAAGLMRGFGVKLWTFVQDLSQLQALYPQSWRTFLGNAGVITAFGVQDTTTCREISSMLGEHLVEQEVWSENYDKGWFIFKPRKTGATKSIERRFVPLLRPEEIASFTTRESGNMIVLRNGRPPMCLKRLPYWKRFKSWQYDRNPGVQ